MEKKEQNQNTSDVDSTNPKPTEEVLFLKKESIIPTNLPPQPNFREWPHSKNKEDEEPLSGGY